jgi:hypothetical protein
MSYPERGELLPFAGPVSPGATPPLPEVSMGGAWHANYARPLKGVNLPRSLLPFVSRPMAGSACSPLLLKALRLRHAEECLSVSADVACVRYPGSSVWT